MQRSRLKLTVILLLALLNIFLLGLVMVQNHQAEEYAREGRMQAMAYLQRNGITVEEKVIPWDSTLTAPVKDPSGLKLVSGQIPQAGMEETWEVRAMRRPETLLVDIANGLKELNARCTSIESITEGYCYSTEAERSIFSPVWAITTDKGSFRLDCSTGELIRY